MAPNAIIPNPEKQLIEALAMPFTVPSISNGTRSGRIVEGNDDASTTEAHQCDCNGGRTNKHLQQHQRSSVQQAADYCDEAVAVEALIIPVSVEAIIHRVFQVNLDYFETELTDIKMLIKGSQCTFSTLLLTESHETSQFSIDHSFSVSSVGMMNSVHWLATLIMVKSLFISTMSRELERRAAVLEGLRAGRTASEIIALFGYGKSFVYNVRKDYETADDKNEVTAKRKTNKRRSDSKRSEEFLAEVKATIDEDPSKSMGRLAKEMNVGRLTIHRAVHEDLCYQSFVLRRRQLLTEATKESRRVKAQALISDLKNHSAGMLRFFSDEKNFIQDRKVNRQNDRWLCEDPSEVPTVMHSKFPASVMVLGVVSSEGHVMPPYFFTKGLKINADDYIDVLSTVVKPWMDEVACGSEYVFQQDSAPAHKARKTQAWCYENLPYHWSPSYPDCNPLIILCGAWLRKGSTRLPTIPLAI